MIGRFVGNVWWGDPTPSGRHTMWRDESGCYWMPLPEAPTQRTDMNMPPKEAGAAEALHAAVCQAVALLNRAPEVARCTEGREARDLLRQALVAYANAYMDEPVTERERATVAAKHQRKPRLTKGDPA
jgi:hypothetical protein